MGKRIPSDLSGALTCRPCVRTAEQKR